jgi:hypothetical protein
MYTEVVLCVVAIVPADIPGQKYQMGMLGVEAGHAALICCTVMSRNFQDARTVPKVMIERHRVQSSAIRKPDRRDRIEQKARSGQTASIICVIIWPIVRFYFLKSVISARAHSR